MAVVKIKSCFLVREYRLGLCDCGNFPACLSSQSKQSYEIFLWVHLGRVVRGRWGTAWCRCCGGWRAGPGPRGGCPPGTCGDTPGTAECQTPGWSSSVRPGRLCPWWWSGPPRSRARSRASLTGRWCRSGCIFSQWSSVRGKCWKSANQLRPVHSPQSPSGARSEPPPVCPPSAGTR